MLQQHQTLTGGDPDRGILSLAVSDEGYLFCGVQGGHVQVNLHGLCNYSLFLLITIYVYIQIWDLETVINQQLYCIVFF